MNGVVQFWDTGSPNYVYRNPNMPSTIEVTTAADSHYNGLQTVLNKRVGHGLGIPECLHLQQSDR